MIIDQLHYSCSNLCWLSSRSEGHREEGPPIGTVLFVGCCGSGAAAHHCGHRERNLAAHRGAEVPATAAEACWGAASAKQVGCELQEL